MRRRPAIALRSAYLTLAAAVLLSACGSSGAAPSALAIVAGQHVTRSDVDAYVNYTDSFYAWAHHVRGAGSTGCATRNRPSRCAVLRRQALARLIEEHVVMAYARANHIRLSARDQSGIAREMTDLGQRGVAGGNLLQSLRVTPAFMREILGREMLVQRVEDTVAPSQVKVGPALHLRHFFVFYGVARSRKQAREEALTLATDGSPVPDNAGVRVDWVAPFRLTADVRSQLSVARPGQFVGPLLGNKSFLVLQLLGRATHRYGRPARQQLEAEYFQLWLARAVRRADPKCFTDGGAPALCPIAARPT